MSSVTEQRTKRLVMIGAALALAAVAILGAAHYPRSSAETHFEHLVNSRRLSICKYYYSVAARPPNRQDRQMPNPLPFL